MSPRDRNEEVFIKVTFKAISTRQTLVNANYVGTKLLQSIDRLRRCILGSLHQHCICSPGVLVSMSSVPWIDIPVCNPPPSSALSFGEVLAMHGKGEMSRAE